MVTLLAIGTGKGLFLATSADRRAWEVSGPHFPMTGVYAVAVDKRAGRPRLLAGMTSSHFGPSVATSDDLGASWQEPDRAPVAFPADTGASLGRVWQLTPAGVDQPDVVWAGAEPSALFRSDDGGRSFELVRALWDHPHRESWAAGFGGQAIHSVLPHPRDPARLAVAMSTGGVYRTEDAGASWTPGNTGIRAYFLPDEWPEFGQCVHKIARDAGDPNRLYAQNHHGVYRSDDDGRTWTSIAAGLPSDFGFPMVAHPSRPGTVYVFPLVADAQRFPADHRCRVYRSTDAGDKWEALSVGLPDEPFYPSVLRDAMCADDADPAGVYFGTRSGEVYASPDEGDSWSLVAAHLPDVLCVRAAEM
ncbi:exo-alpha-sialidase [Micromonospora sp. DR5-3]|uniref:WD40/YVTN/BNR-like repeat-containing protein n=1 Tax=unclassified Micromonospora TaxID=2617518 RepID=UPI0011D854B7|nr:MULTISPECIES: exo-alpha-sialidase [unclassified Micromonospora]MCW3817077.1 exo-alpha-sialidase [Micromonospora sp. DR5-3]TYC22393.1 exo-alpha-sialidase [Micromonospora sp. MP36]